MDSTNKIGISNFEFRSRRSWARLTAFALVGALASACSVETQEDEITGTDEGELAVQALATQPLGVCAVMYTDPGFGGMAIPLMATDTRPQMPVLSNQISSVIVGNGCRLKLWRHANFSGALEVYPPGYHVQVACNDAASSLKCECDGVSQPEGTPRNVAGWAYDGIYNGPRLPLLRGHFGGLVPTTWNNRFSSVVMNDGASATFWEGPLRTGISDAVDPGRSVKFASTRIGNDAVTSFEAR